LNVFVKPRMINANQYECDVLANIIHDGPDIYVPHIFIIYPNA